jgi:hypothetical protein
VNDSIGDSRDVVLRIFCLKRKLPMYIHTRILFLIIWTQLSSMGLEIINRDSPHGPITLSSIHANSLR